MLCVKLLILQARKANGVLWLISPTCLPHPSIFQAKSVLSSCRPAFITSRIGEIFNLAVSLHSGPRNLLINAVFC